MKRALPDILKVVLDHGEWSKTGKRDGDPEPDTGGWVLAHKGPTLGTPISAFGSDISIAGAAIEKPRRGASSSAAPSPAAPGSPLRAARAPASPRSPRSPRRAPKQQQQQQAAKPPRASPARAARRAAAAAPAGADENDAPGAVAVNGAGVEDDEEFDDDIEALMG